MGRRNIRPPLAGGGPARSGELFRRGPFSDDLDHICGKKRRPARATGGESSRPPRLAVGPPPCHRRPAAVRRAPAISFVEGPLGRFGPFLREKNVGCPFSVVGSLSCSAELPRLCHDDP